MAFLEISQRTLDLPTDDLTAFRTANRELEESFSERFRSGAWSSQFDLSTVHALAASLWRVRRSHAAARDARSMACWPLALGCIKQNTAMPDTLDDLKQVGRPAKLYHRAVSRLAFASWILPWPCGDFNRENIDATPDVMPQIEEGSNQWDRMWLWQLDK